MSRDELTRRDFLIGAGILSATSVLAVGHEIFPKLFSPVILSASDESDLLALVRTKQIRTGLYPDFEREGPDALQTIDAHRQHLEISTVGSFALLEDATKPERMELHRQVLQSQESIGVIPQISLGMGSGWDPHPFDPRHFTTQEKLIRHWIAWLLHTTTGIVHLRFLFEPNIFAGDIAYKNTGAFSDSDHQSHFKRLFSIAAAEIRAQDPGGERIKLDLSFTAAGRSILPYLPECDVNAVGIDIYPEPYGYLAQWTLYQQLIHDPLVWPKNNVLLELKDHIGPMYGDGAKRILTEIGTTESTLAWFKTMLLLYFGFIGDEVLYFGVDKSATENQDYSLKPASRDILASMHP